MRVGIGYDAHRLVKGTGMWLGGVYIKCNFSVLAYSDGDVIIHAIIDALLGAANLGDIGKQFPSHDPAYKDISGLELLKSTKVLLEGQGMEIINIDVTLIAETPKIAEQTSLMEENISVYLKLDEISQINIKATTTDGLGFEGSKYGVSCQAICLLKERDSD
tara:strand:- start:1130 stop:1615 length:486 start_codon:yes stop_codon:yes gene_type:complete